MPRYRLTLSASPSPAAVQARRVWVEAEAPTEATALLLIIPELLAAARTRPQDDPLACIFPVLWECVGEPLTTEQEPTYADADRNP